MKRPFWELAASKIFKGIEGFMCNVGTNSKVHQGSKQRYFLGLEIKGISMILEKKMHSF